MDKARAQELLANERARLERLLRAEIAATAPDTGDDVDDANWRIAEETGRAVSRSLRDRWSALERAEERLQRGTYGRSIPSERLEADPLAELLVEEAAVEAFRARRSTETVSGLTSTRRTLAALADREENADDSRRTRGARRTEEAEGPEDVEGPEEGEDLDVEALDDGELIDEEETPADFEGEADDVEVDEESEEAGEAKQAEEEAEERPPQRRRSGRG